MFWLGLDFLAVASGGFDKHTMKQNQTPTENQIQIPPQNYLKKWRLLE